jgi:hypothetical protein
MRNVIYAATNSGYACGECGEPIEPEDMFNDKWKCGHEAYVEAVAVVVVGDAKEG